MRRVWTNGVIFTAAVACAAPALATNWVSVATSSKGAKIYVDRDSISRSGDFVTAWEKWDNSATNPPADAWLEKNRKIYDCRNRKIRLSAAVDYRRDGSIIDQFEWAPGENEFHDAIPESIGEAVLDEVCGTGGAKGVSPPPG